MLSNRVQDKYLSITLPEAGGGNHLVEDEEVAIWPLHKAPVLLRPVLYPRPAEHLEDALQLYLQTRAVVVTSSTPTQHAFQWESAAY